MEIYVGIDIAKETHWACALDASARVLLDRALDNDQAAIERFLADLRGLGGDVVVGLDITGSLARFLEAILLAERLRLVHVPGIAVNRAGQGFAGGARARRRVTVIWTMLKTRHNFDPAKKAA